MRKKSGRRTAVLVSLTALVILTAFAWTNWAEIRFFLDFESIGKNAQGYPEYRHRETGIVFVRLPGGTFDMGTPKEEIKRLIAELGERWREAYESMGTPKEDTNRLIVERGSGWREKLESEQQRSVTVGPFLIAKFEVTQAQWGNVMGENPYHSHHKGDDFPVGGPSWEASKRFCEKTVSVR